MKRFCINWPALTLLTKTFILQLKLGEMYLEELV